MKEQGLDVVIVPNVIADETTMAAIVSVLGRAVDVKKDVVTTKSIVDPGQRLADRLDTLSKSRMRQEDTSLGRLNGEDNRHKGHPVSSLRTARNLRKGYQKWKMSKLTT